MNTASQISYKPVEQATCNRCKTTHKEDQEPNFYEFQEMMHYEFVGGYGSIFGDGCKVKLTLCQNCQHELFKDFIEITDPYEDEEK